MMARNSLQRPRGIFLAVDNINTRPGEIARACLAA